jgi:hypothetical protein
VNPRRAACVGDPFNPGLRGSAGLAGVLETMRFFRGFSGFYFLFPAGNPIFATRSKFPVVRVHPPERRETVGK